MGYAQFGRGPSSVLVASHTGFVWSRRDASNKTSMEEVEFYKLPRAVQDRFIDSARGAAAPTPLAVAPLEVTTHLKWVGAAAGCLALLALIAAHGYGNLASSSAVASPAMVPVYAGLVALAAVFALRAVSIRRAPLLFPYRPAVYLFPCGVVDCREPKFRMHPISDASDIAAAGSVLVVRYSNGGSFSFKSGSAARAGEGVQAAEEARHRYADALANFNRRELAVMDPLRDTGFSNPFSPKTSRQPPAQRWMLSAVPAAVALSVVLGWQSWELRNAWSADKLYAIAHARNTPQAYRAYLQRGGKRRDVAEILLPRAELAVAEKQGTVDAIEQFEREHPNVKIRAEVDLALKKALLDELDRAKQLGTLTALTELSKRYAKVTLVQADYDAAVDAIFTRALADFRGRMAKEDPELLEFGKALLGFAKKNGPVVEFRFHREVKESLEKSDQQIRRDAYFGGEAMLPAQYFDTEHARGREQVAAKALIDAWQKAFPPDIVMFKLGPDVDSPSMPAITVPTFLVEHSTSGAGIYRNPKPRGVFIGVGLVFDGQFQIPGHAATLGCRWTSWRVPDLQGLKAGDLKLEEVYSRMAEDGFSRFVKQCISSWFRPS